MALLGLVVVGLAEAAAYFKQEETVVACVQIMTIASGALSSLFFMGLFTPCVNTVVRKQAQRQLKGYTCIGSLKYGPIRVFYVLTEKYESQIII